MNGSKQIPLASILYFRWGLDKGKTGLPIVNFLSSEAVAS